MKTRKEIVNPEGVTLGPADGLRRCLQRRRDPGVDCSRRSESFVPTGGGGVKEHAEWCNVELANGSPCDCGGNGGACDVCGAIGPCAVVDGVPLTCAPSDDGERMGP